MTSVTHDNSVCHTMVIRGMKMKEKKQSNTGIMTLWNVWNSKMHPPPTSTSINYKLMLVPEPSWFLGGKIRLAVKIRHANVNNGISRSLPKAAYQ